MKYLSVETISRGIPQLILLYLMIILNSNAFSIFILIYAIESFIVLLLPTNYVETLYAKNKFNISSIIVNMLIVTFIIIISLLTLLLIFRNNIFSFFNYDGLLVYISILFSAFFNSFFRFKRILLQLDFLHEEAINLMFKSFFVSNLFSIMFLILIDDKIFGFFVGKSLGVILFGIYYLLKQKIKLSLDLDVIRYFMNTNKYLFFYAIFSWVLGYGFLYIAKVISTEEEVAIIGYIIVLSMPFLLISNAINQLYIPKIKAMITNNSENVVNVTKIFFKWYIYIFFISICFFWIVFSLDIEYIYKFKLAFLLSILIFLFSIIKYLLDIYIFSNGFFYEYIKVTIFFELIMMLLIIIFTYLINEKLIVYMYPLLTLVRSLSVIYIVKSKHLLGRL
ncbi:hypothetical protein ACNSOP_08320 [Aliarcobacter lanthieri]|uniref:hypothetical protein n=1 Tax=Aliarcobacter lanthieri TaxID=1355374 RepID=UPI003AAECF67